jgi:predicted Rossmann-fold nucleotide-binding protein
MKVVTDGVQASGGRLTGISIVFLRKWVKKDADEMTFAMDLADRKARLLAVMPGGVGMLGEGTEVLELRKHGLYDDPVVLLNTAGFHDGLTLKLRPMDEQGLLPLPLGQLVFVADTAAGALAYVEKYVGTDGEIVTARLPA